MSKDAFTLTSPDGKTIELPVRKGATGPDVIDISKLYREQGVFTYDPGFVSTGSCIGVTRSSSSPKNLTS
jgi:citrate synthase